MASVVGLNRGTREHSIHSFHLYIRHLPLMLKVVRREMFFHDLSYTGHHPSKAHGVG